MGESGSGRAAPAAVLALVLNAFVWGVSWWPFQALQGHGVHPLWATALIYILCVAVLVAVRPGALRGWSAHPWLWLLAASAGMTNVGFNWAVTVGDVVRVVLLFYLMPAWSVLLAWLLLGEKPHAAALVRVGVALVGVSIVLGGGALALPLPRTLPDALAIAGGFSFALTNALLRKLHGTPPASRVLAMFGGGALMAGTLAWIGSTQGWVGGMPAPSMDWLPLALVLSAAFLVGNVALQYGASRLATHTTALVMLSEVVFASLSSVALGAARLEPHVLLGGALILVTAAWSAWPSRSPVADGAQ